MDSNPQEKHSKSVIIVLLVAVDRFLLLKNGKCEVHHRPDGRRADKRRGRTVRMVIDSDRRDKAERMHARDDFDIFDGNSAESSHHGGV